VRKFSCIGKQQEESRRDKCQTYQALELYASMNVESVCDGLYSERAPKGQQAPASLGDRSCNALQLHVGVSEIASDTCFFFVFCFLFLAL